MSHNFLARTHHIRSLRKLATLGASTERNSVFVIFKYGKPGIFYCEGNAKGVSEWAKSLKQLNYMGYTLCSAPNAIVRDPGSQHTEQHTMQRKEMRRLDTTAEFAKHMEERGVLNWWRIKMGFTGEMKEEGTNS
jgi:hypothetical protein